MNLADVMKEAADVLAELTGLQVFDYPPPSVKPPAGYISYPLAVNYDQAYQQGEDEFRDFPIVLIASKITDRSARDMVSAWTSGDSPESVKQAFENHSWVSCDDLTINSAEIDGERIGGVDYLTVLFKATVVGPREA